MEGLMVRDPTREDPVVRSKTRDEEAFVRCIEEHDKNKQYCETQSKRTAFESFRAAVWRESCLDDAQRHRRRNQLQPRHISLECLHLLCRARDNVWS